MQAQVSSCQPSPGMSKHRHIQANHIQAFWNCDSSQEIKLRINAFMNPYKEALVVPSQCSVIPKGKKIKIVVVNKSTQRMDSFGINRDQDDCIFGMADIVSKKKVSFDLKLLAPTLRFQILFVAF